MSLNVLYALETILDRQASVLPSVIDHVNSNRINGVGDLLEFYVKDAFCREALDFDTTDKKLECYQNVFSYLGNANNPPDFIIKGGIAVEVKKKEGKGVSEIALNSSQPKDFLYHDDLKINIGCRNCENDIGGWTKKEMVYAVGNVVGTKIHSLWLIHGDCYAADKATYERIALTLKNGVTDIPGVEFATTKEFGRVNRVDPLGITNLRIRGMWIIAHPGALHRNLVELDNEKTNVFVLMKKDTYDAIHNKPNLNRFIESGILTIADVEIPNPNNPAKKLDAVLFSAKF